LPLPVLKIVPAGGILPVPTIIPDSIRTRSLAFMVCGFKVVTSIYKVCSSQDFAVGSAPGIISY